VLFRSAELPKLRGQAHMTNSIKTDTTKGHCLCGDIRFEYRGSPIETMHCHCESCRRHTSSPLASFVIVDKGNFRYTRGTPVAYASSPGVERTHCGRCGSPIAYENKDEFALYACTLEDPTGVVPTFHSWTAEQMPWLEIADVLPRYAHGSHNATPVSYGPRRTAGNQ
jgi:hypothetical protein